MQAAALAISSGNGLLLNGGKEASATIRAMMKMINSTLQPYNISDAIVLVKEDEQLQELLSMADSVDLVIPRGSSELVKKIGDQCKNIPILAHSFGICHVFLDKDCDPEKAKRIGRLLAYY